MAGAIPAPTISRLRAALAIFGSPPATTRPGPGLAEGTHRAALLTWLNAWGCRIRVPRWGEDNPFDDGVAAWWRSWWVALPPTDVAMADLGDDQIDAIARAYDALAGVVVARNAAGHARTMGATAAAKALHALRPAAVMPWDAAIADRLHGARDAAAFAAHLCLGRRWARALLRRTGLDEPALLARLDRPDSTLARVLDEYCWVAYTRGW